jgi:hypothetical protein
MALTTDQQNQLRAIYSQEGPALHGEINSLIASDHVTSAITDLANYGTVTITDWAAIAAFIPTGNPATIPTLMTEIAAAITAQNGGKMGPLLVALYAASKANLGL